MPTHASRRASALSGAVALVAAGVALGTAPVGAAPQHPAAAAKSKIYNAALLSVSVAPRSGTAWALGTQSTKTGASTFYALRHSGSHWTSVKVKTPTGAQLAAIAAGSPTSVWAVGYSDPASTKPLIVHSTGGGFKPYKTKLAAGTLTQVSASSKSNIWAVGSGTTATPNTPYIARSNGKKWTLVNDATQLSYTYTQVSASSPNNVWFLGTNLGQSVAGIWNGHAFSSVNIPHPTDVTLTAIATTSAKNTWVVGYSAVGTTRVSYKTFTERWNGQTWKKVKAPSPAFYSQPVAVAAAGSHAFLVGSASPKSGATSAPYVLRFAGGKWKSEGVASPGRQSNLRSVSVSTKSAVAVGFWSLRGQCGVAHPTPNLPLGETLAGNKWKQGSTPKLRRSLAHLRFAPSAASC